MRNLKTFYKGNWRACHFILLLTTFLFPSYTVLAQGCPPNIDFETGSFSGWTCYTGFTAAVGQQNTITVSPSGGPVENRHTMYSATAIGQRDPYGNFPVNCPNGSGHSIRLGNDQGGGEAEGISYEFTIPANRNTYSLIYHYAVVFQDPHHQEYEQPRMVTEITNVTDNTIISCSSFGFFPYGTLLPGFFISTTSGSDVPVWCKDWSAVSINLNGMAGKTIRLFFKTADCTFRRHFGYAYIDVNSECSGEFVGATYCPDDTAINVVAPYGYEKYTWFNSGFSSTLGNQQLLSLKPPPAAGTTIAVEVVPYSGYGCLDTLYARLIDTLTVTAFAGDDAFSCNREPVPIGRIPKPGLVYSWSPAAGLTNPLVANPFAKPDVTTTYVLTVRNSGGGCVDTDTVLVQAAVIDNSLQVVGKDMYCLGNEDSAVLVVHPADSIQWFRENFPITGANQTRYRVSQTGNYHAVLYKNGCSMSTEAQHIVIDKARVGISYPVQYALNGVPYNLEARNFGIGATWSPGNYLNTRNSYTPIFQGSGEQLYTIEIKTASGCVTVDTQMVKTVRSVEIYVPTAFSPNNDGLNDVLRPTLMGIKELRYFRIYNRWGQLLFENHQGKGWDGKLNGSSQGSQVVVWVAEGLGLDGKSYTKKGTTMLVR